MAECYCPICGNAHDDQELRSGLQPLRLVDGPEWDGAPLCEPRHLPGPGATFSNMPPPEAAAPSPAALLEKRATIVRALREGQWFIPGISHPVDLSAPLDPEELAAIKYMLGEDEDG